MTTVLLPRFSVALLAALLPIAISCTPTCPPGTTRAGDKCVRPIDDGQAGEANEAGSTGDLDNDFTTAIGASGRPSKRSPLGSTNAGATNAGAVAFGASGTAAPNPGTAGPAASHAGTGTGPAMNSGDAKDAGPGGSALAQPDASISSNMNATDAGIAMGGPKPPMCGNGVVEMGELCDGNCPTACPTTSMCLRGELTGSVSECSVKCTEHTIVECEPGDGCCPNGCNFAQDSDCPKSCGDGSVDPPEVCEPTSASHPCPTSCDDGDPCTNDMLMGSAAQCTATCAHSVKFASGSVRDSCCPKGSNALNDADCDPSCGNNVVEPGEECDGNCPTSCPSGGDPCMAFEVQGTGCSRQCVGRPRTASRLTKDNCCPANASANDDLDCAPTCGNGITEPGEKCDADCPSSCIAGGDPCHPRTLRGTNCTRECVAETLTASTRGHDECCPDGADATTDLDCYAGCGNGRLDAEEICDNSSTVSSEHCIQPYAFCNERQPCGLSTADTAKRACIMRAPTLSPPGCEVVSGC